MEKNRVGRLTIPNLKIDYISVVINSVVLEKKGHIDKWDRMESPKIDPYKYQLNFDKRAKKYNGEKIVFSANGAETTGHPHAKKNNNLDTDIISFTKINSKLITDLNIKFKTIKILEDNIGETLD